MMQILILFVVIIIIECNFNIILKCSKINDKAFSEDNFFEMVFLLRCLFWICNILWYYNINFILNYFYNLNLI